MGKGHLIDTNTIIDYLEVRMPSSAMSFIDNIDVKFSVVTRIEILVWPKATPAQLQTLNEFINSSTVFALDENIIQRTIEIRRNYKLKLPDAIIAATAVANDLILLTRNTKDFEKVAALKSIDPHSL